MLFNLLSFWNKAVMRFSYFNCCFVPCGRDVSTDENMYMFTESSKIEPQRASTYIGSLPVELVINIAEAVGVSDLKDIITMRQLCKRFNKIIVRNETALSARVLQRTCGYLRPQHLQCLVSCDTPILVCLRAYTFPWVSEVQSRRRMEIDLLHKSGARGQLAESLVSEASIREFWKAMGIIKYKKMGVLLEDLLSRGLEILHSISDRTAGSVDHASLREKQVNFLTDLSLEKLAILCITTKYLRTDFKVKEEAGGLTASESADLVPAFIDCVLKFGPYFPWLYYLRLAMREGHEGRCWGTTETCTARAAIINPESGEIDTHQAIFHKMQNIMAQRLDESKKDVLQIAWIMVIEILGY